MNWRELYNEAEALQNLLVAQATGGHEDGNEYLRLRQVLLSQPAIEAQLPHFLRTCRSLFQFWEFIKYKFRHYADRRAFVWNEFRPLLELLERGGPAPSDEAVGEGLVVLEAAGVQAVWSKALDRRNADPEGAITMARTLLETVCKHILDEVGSPYTEGSELPSLYKLTSEHLNLAPSQHTEEVFKQILGGCTSVVNGLGALRNRLSDAHGKGKMGVRPSSRHAELAVNLAGAMATYLVATWKSRTETAT
jgi:hypothetical protein